MKNVIQLQAILNKPQEFKHFLCLLYNISSNHHRFPGFFDKILQILLFYEKEIKQTFSNQELFTIFMNNKYLLLILFQKGIISVDESISNLIYQTHNYHFFYTEIKPFLSIEKIRIIENELLSIDSNVFDNYEEKKQNGENETYICTLIRNDSIQEFVRYVNLTKFPISSQIKPSIFETNEFLIENEPTLIEYAAFFGSFKIFTYLKSKLNEIPKNLFLYSIHSNSSKMIHVFEDNNIEICSSFTDNLIESIKCHHNSIADYLENKRDQSLEVDEEAVIENAFNSYNYFFFPEKFDQPYIFYYFYHFEYFEIVDFILKSKEEEIKKELIQK